MSTTARILIVGAGQAGGRTAQALRRAGHSGPITLLGDESWPPYERPQLSKALLLGTLEPAALQLADEVTWSEQNISLRCNTTVTRVLRGNREVHTADGERMAYDRLVIATGSSARAFTGLCAPGATLLQLRTLADAAVLRLRLTPNQRVVLIGAGFVGLEVAASARSLGAEVTLIEAAGRPLERLLPSEFAERLVKLHRMRGVNVELGVQVSAIDARLVRLADGRMIPADTVVVGIGARPNAALAEAAGLAVRDGILVDAKGCSSDPSIYAVGDVARTVDVEQGIDQRLESWRNAEDSAQAVAAAICGSEPPLRRVRWFWSDQYGYNIQISGEPEDHHERVDRHAPANGPQLSYYLHDGVLRGVIGIDCAREIRNAMKLIEIGGVVQHSQLVAPRVRAPVASSAAV